MEVYYFYTKRTKTYKKDNGFVKKSYEVIQVPKKENESFHIAENKARTIARQNNTELAGGMTCKLYNGDDYNIIKCDYNTIQTEPPPNPYLDFIIPYENNELNDEEIVEGMQMLINSGVAYKLQGHYGRLANNLIENGLCQAQK